MRGWGSVPPSSSPSPLPLSSSESDDSGPTKQAHVDVQRERVRKRGCGTIPSRSYDPSVSLPSSLPMTSAAAPLPRVPFLRRPLAHLRARMGSVGFLLLMVGAATLCCLLGCTYVLRSTMMIPPPELPPQRIQRNHTAGLAATQAQQRPAQPMGCSATEAVHFPGTRVLKTALIQSSTSSVVQASTAALLHGTYAFDEAQSAPEIRRYDGKGGVAALVASCAARVAENTAWARTRRENGPSSDAALYTVPVAPHFGGKVSYVTTGGPVCLHAGYVYLTAERIRAGVEVFEEAKLTVLPLTDAVLARHPHAGAPPRELRVVPVMAVLLRGAWIATHFLHLITDTLEVLYSTYHSWQEGLLLQLPTQTVLLHDRKSDWVDRRGDTSGKMEVAAAVANAFSSPGIAKGSPYNASFLFRTQPRSCTRGGADTPDAFSTLCFCDGLLVRPYRSFLLDGSVFYGIQDWVARQFDEAPYGEHRSVQEMERLRRPDAASPWASTRVSSGVTRAPGGFPDGAIASSRSSRQPTHPYQPRVLFVHRTTRLISNATRYAQWMRDTGFRVEEVYLETLTAAQQYYLGRYADVVVAMHGLGIGHAMWMERSPPYCRTVIEFRPWVTPSMPTQPRLLLGRAMQFHFVTVEPVDVRFGPSVVNPTEERALLMSSARMIDAFRYPSFTDQTAVYSDAEVQHRIDQVWRHLQQCLPS